MLLDKVTAAFQEYELLPIKRLSAQTSPASHYLLHHFTQASIWITVCVCFCISACQSVCKNFILCFSGACMSAAFYYITILRSAFERIVCMHVCIGVCVRVRVCVPDMLHSTLTVLWDISNPLSDEAKANDRDVKWRQIMNGSWPLTPVIRYGPCNWLAVFSINRHYGPLCQPAPLVALLFLEAPGSNRAPVLALSVPQVFCASLSSA